jgi:hypothetical protein
MRMFSSKKNKKAKSVGSETTDGEIQDEKVETRGGASTLVDSLHLDKELFKPFTVGDVNQI